ncbi:hypothetical protein B0H15DRAFT_861497 [Mycena belliarum]|uniref:DUF6533 domain-containing protein n=1 Tax=Mycena belliarum TaxID=1033014 RepID=A0AAD6XNX6_9AGAR|nr:hypothetical protein B0H15DRAFT_861497 [Mycena belliae]
MATFAGTPQAAVRITSLSILVYDYIVTIPSEIRLYKRQKSFCKPSLACVFFVLARYVGLFYICWVSYVFFGTGWSDARCGQLAPVGAVLRGIVSTISATVFIWRTWAIWGKNRYIWMTMTLVLIPVSVFSYAPGLAQVPVVVNGGCTAVSKDNGPLSHKWTFALVNLCFDTMACVLGSIPLVRNVRQGASHVSGILLTDGLGYFIIAVATQTLNLSFLLSTDRSKQGTMLTLQTVITAILAQRIITSLSERTSSVNSSQHDSRSRSLSGTRNRARSRSRSLSNWRARAPGMPIHGFVPGSHAGTGSEDCEPGGTNPIEMIKVEVEVTTETLRSAGDGFYAPGGHRGYGGDHKITYAA